jgi:hypothetical protein
VDGVVVVVVVVGTVLHIILYIHKYYLKTTTNDKILLVGTKVNNQKIKISKYNKLLLFYSFFFLNIMPNKIEKEKKRNKI